MTSPHNQPNIDHTIALDTKGGLHVHAPICILDESANTIVCLQMIGAPEAVKANWASLVSNGRQYVHIGSSVVRLKGMADHICLKSPLPIGWQDWVLIHKQASYEQMNPERPFYLLDNGTQPVPPSFFLMLDKALSIPLMPEWTAYLWSFGMERRLIHRLDNRDQQYTGWKVTPNKKQWAEIVATGLQQGIIHFIVNGERIEQTETEPNVISSYTLEDAINDEALFATDEQEALAYLSQIQSQQFPLGKLVCTPGVMSMVEKGVPLYRYLARHAASDWGDLDPTDIAANNRALQDGTRLFSSYQLDNNCKLWIITEADRSSTCLLLPSEY